MEMVTSVTWSTPANRSVSVNIISLDHRLSLLILPCSCPFFLDGNEAEISSRLHMKPYVYANLKLNHNRSAWVTESGSQSWSDRVRFSYLPIHFPRKKRERRGKEGRERVFIRLPIAEKGLF